MASALIQSVTKMASRVATFPLAAAIVVPLVFIIPLSILLYYLHSESTPTENVKNAAEQTNASLVRQNRNAAASKTSLASLDVRPFMDSLQQRHIDSRTGEYGVATAEADSKLKDTPSAIRPIFFAFTLGALLSLICGLIYLTCAASGITAKAISLPLSISVILIPSLLLPYVISACPAKFSNPDTATPAVRWQAFLRNWIPLLASFIVGILGTWASPYMVIAALSLALITLSVLAFATACQWPRPMTQGRSRLNGNRNTKSWFSGNVLSEADAEALARQGNMPRPGEIEEDFLKRMQQEGNSWVTETGKLLANPDTESRR